MHAKRLLVLDDDTDVAATICMMAGTAGYETEQTDNTEVFFDRVVAWVPSHVAVDLQLVQQDGIDVLLRLAGMDCDPAVIIISGLGGRILGSSARVAAESGLRVAGVLPKPFSRAALLAGLAADLPSPKHARDRNTAGDGAISREQLIDALRNREFVAFFQPKISCGSGSLAGFECLARWLRADGSMVQPDRFIGVAERTGLIHELTRQIHDHALSSLTDLPGGSGLKIALNLSPINLDDEGFPLWLLDRCAALGIAPSRIVLELTETASMDKPLTLLEKLTQFRIRGFHLSIDDFGVGYSSLVQLARLPFSELKVDQMFVRTLAESEESRKIVSAIVGLGHSLDLNVVAEGVEDAWALEFLHDIGCDEAQGYYIARPMDLMSARAWQTFTETRAR